MSSLSRLCSGVPQTAALIVRRPVRRVTVLSLMSSGYRRNHPRIVPSVLHRTGGIQCHPRSVIGKTVAKMEGLLGAGNFRFGMPK
jgi:hypothetical protein